MNHKFQFLDDLGRYITMFLNHREVMAETQQIWLYVLYPYF